MDEREDDVFDENHLTNIPWIILLFLASMTIAICMAHDVSNRKVNIDKYNRQTIVNYQSFYLSLYYGNNTISVNEFFKRMQDISHQQGFRIKLILLVVAVAYVGTTFSFTTFVIFYLPNWINRHLNVVHSIGNYLLGNAAWFFIPYIYSTIYGLLMTAFMLLICFVIFQVLYSHIFPLNYDIYFFGSLSSCYLTFFLYYMTKMTVAHYTVRVWYGGRDFQAEFINALQHIVGYHLGTLSFNATLILPILVALKRVMRKHRYNLRNIHHYYRRENSTVKQFFRYLYMTVFIADYSSIITARNCSDAHTATDTLFRLVRNGLPVQTLRKVDNRCMKLTIILTSAYFVVLNFWYTCTGQDIALSKIVFLSCCNVLTVIILPLVWMVYGNIAATVNICQWIDDENERESVAVAG